MQIQIKTRKLHFKRKKKEDFWLKTTLGVCISVSSNVCEIFTEVKLF